ncbi:McrC family protein [Psychrilyobacter atlanticus]|uniref:McrC family protein n=1 Tax=Psychrilyobacter atlanticus TaxID=271091 RepID=UPI0003F67214|nr:McrC family protein [Psychrilyobacter atlanticus]
MSKHITVVLTEYQFLQTKDKNEKNYIDEKTFTELENFILENESVAQYLKITMKRPFCKVLQAQNYVGVIQTKSGITIEILPKIADVEDEKKEKEILIKMLKTLKKSPFKNFNTANLKSTNMPLLEIFISMFLEELSKLIKKGIKSDYISKSENLKFMKGKFKMSEQIKQNYIHRERFFIEYCEFSNDRIENRLIKTTLKFLYSKSKSNGNKKRIREFLFIFDEIKISHNIKIDFDKVKINRQIKDYEQTLLWSKTFLLENSFSPYKGREVAFALLFDMNLLFESYVGQYLKKKGLDVKLQDSKHHLAYLKGQGKFRLKPDIVINIKKKEKIIIADTKWKILNESKTHNGVNQGDMYQLYAYGTKYENCRNMYLIYPKNNKINGEKYNYLKEKQLNLNIVFFDLVKDKFRRSM